MTLAQLRVLATIVEVGGFSAAAARLALTQSGVSHAVAILEVELGVRLLRRQRGGPVPTAIGERVLAHAREMLRRDEEIRQEVAAVTGQTGGKVLVGAPPSVAARLLPQMLDVLRPRLPKLEVVLFEGNDSEVEHWLRSRVIDVAILPMPLSDLETVDLAVDEMLFVMPERHSAARRQLVRLREVVADPFIMPKSGCEALIRELYRRQGLEPRVRYEASDVDTVIDMVQEGLGVTLVPELALPPRLPRLHLVRLEPRASRRLGLAVTALSRCPPSVAMFAHEALSSVPLRFRAKTTASPIGGSSRSELGAPYRPATPMAAAGHALPARDPASRRRTTPAA